MRCMGDHVLLLACVAVQTNGMNFTLANIYHYWKLNFLHRVCTAITHHSPVYWIALFHSVYFYQLADFDVANENKRLFLIADFLKYQLQDRCCIFLEQHWPIVNHAFIKFLRRPVLWSSRDAKVVKRLVVFLLENCRNFHCLSQRNLAWTLKKFNCLCAPLNLTLYSTRYAIVRCWVLGQKVKWA